MRAKRWKFLGFCLVLLLIIYGGFSLDLEGLALLEFRSGVEIDPHGVFENWNPSDEDPCNWRGVHCVDGNVESLYLNELALRGVLTPEIGKLSHLRALVLHGNNFTGVIPKEIGDLTMLELLDLRGNSLRGTIPVELGRMMSLKSLMLCDNKFQGGVPSWIEKLDMVSDLKYNSELSCEMDSEIWSTNGHRLKFRSESSQDHEEKHGYDTSNDFAEKTIMQSVHVHTVRHRLLQETSNLPAIPSSSAPPREGATVPSVGSGSFPAVPNDGNSRKKEPKNPPNSSPSGSTINNTDNTVEPASNEKSGIWLYVYVAAGAVTLLISVAILLLLCCRRKGGAIGPWKTGLSGQLQKAFVTGVPKVTRPELEAACEDFSNIITTFPLCTLFKGTLSSGVEICVLSTIAKSAIDWSEQSELCFRKKIDTLSRVNHKNFVNLLGYCEEKEPFMRMMVFEYSPNGTLFDHLHVKEYEPLDWTARMRVIMGIAYCLQYMHHDINHPVALPELQSTAVFITDDFAAKLVDIGVFNEAACKKAIAENDEKDASKLSDADPESNVHSFGMLMLEIVSGKFPYSEEDGSIVDWAANYLNHDRSFISMVDPTLKASNENELEVICELAHGCLCHDPRKRPSMKEVTLALREVLGISPEAAAPRLSPLWWAELEILSVEAS